MRQANATPHRKADIRSLSAEVRGIRLHYLAAGDPGGPPVLLWHGFLGTCRVWRRVIPLLADAGFAVLAPVMRGYGDSDKPPGVAGYDARALAEEFRGLVRQTGFGGGRPILLVGHDMGHHRLSSGPPTIRRRWQALCTRRHPSCSRRS